jgi:hypothetical protein
VNDIIKFVFKQLETRLSNMHRAQSMNINPTQAVSVARVKEDSSVDSVIVTK